MSRIAPLDPANADGTAKELLDGVAAQFGATPNMFTTMARSNVLQGYLALSGALRGGSVRAATGERIALAVAEANGCSYCLSAHSYLAANVAHLDDDEIDRSRRFESQDPRAGAILAFARAVLDGHGGVSDTDVDAAYAAGLSDEELAETVGHVAVNVLTNYFNKAFDVDVDFPVVEPAVAGA
jgi:AhpD family alkylhydroperoxidase